jgi:aminoglycoside phosphotransferase (APT) family kinase protein
VTSPPEWQAERSVSAEDVRALLVAAGEKVSGPVHLVAEGWDNFIFAADDAYVRLTRRKIAVPDIEKEVQLLPLLCARLPTRVPEVRLTSAPGVTWPWFSYTPVPGEELAFALARELPPSLEGPAHALGQVLAVLHDPARIPEVRDFVRGDSFRKCDIPHRIAGARARLEALRERGFDVDFEALTRVLDAAEGLPALQSSTLVHGDLHIRHLMLDEELQLAGIIDWGDAHFGHPAVDLSIYWSAFTPSERAAFQDAYGPIPDEHLRSARVLALFISAILTLSARDFGLPHVERAALRGLDRVLT